MVGTGLDAALFERLAGHDLDRVANKALLLVTMDQSGWPHPAVLSYFEVVAKDRENIRLATYRDATAARSARRQGKATLAILDDRTACYIKGTLSELSPMMVCAPENAKLNVRVERVLSDAPESAESEAVVTGGITYHDPNAAAALVRARRVLAELLE